MGVAGKIASVLSDITAGRRRWSGRPSGVHPSARIIASHVAVSTKIGACSLVHNSRIHGQVEIGDHSAVVESLVSGPVRIGRYTSFNGPGSDITAKVHEVTIGNFCSIARNCTIQEFNHITERCSTYYMFRNLIDAEQRQGCIWGGSEEKDIESRGPITIGHDVWIGAQVVILSGVTIGNGAVIAANATVAGDVPPYAIVGGTPAKVLRYRFPEEMIQRLQNLAWWDWDDAKLRDNRELFSGTLTLEKLQSVRNAL